jgi:hypothetical protein
MHRNPIGDVALRAVLRSACSRIGSLGCAGSIASGWYQRAPRLHAACCIAGAAIPHQVRPFQRANSCPSVAARHGRSRSWHKAHHRRRRPLQPAAFGRPAVVGLADVPAARSPRRGCAGRHMQSKEARPPSLRQQTCRGGRWGGNMRPAVDDNTRSSQPPRSRYPVAQQINSDQHRRNGADRPAGRITSCHTQQQCKYRRT